MRFAPEYVSCVLNENFEDAKALFLEPLMAIHYAHLVMLAECGHRVARGRPPHPRRRWTRIDRTAVREAALRRHATKTCSSTSSACSSTACGDDVAGRLHTARSRNDIDMTLYRMRQRQYVLAVLRRQPAACARRWSTLAGAAPRDDPRAAHAHAAGAALDRGALPARRHRATGARRGAAARRPTTTTNRNPLGACAITGTGFPDRPRR